MEVLRSCHAHGFSRTTHTLGLCGAPMATSCRPVLSMCCRPTKTRARRLSGMHAAPMPYLSAPGAASTPWRTKPGQALLRKAHRAREAEGGDEDLPRDPEFVVQDRCPEAMANCLRQHELEDEHEFGPGDDEAAVYSYDDSDEPSDDEASSEHSLCNWESEDPEPSWEPPWVDQSAWMESGLPLPGVSLPDIQQDVTVVTSVATRSTNKAPGTLWEVLPHVASVTSLSSEVSSLSVESEPWQQIDYLATGEQAGDPEWLVVTD